MKRVVGELFERNLSFVEYRRESYLNSINASNIIAVFLIGIDVIDRTNLSKSCDQRTVRAGKSIKKWEIFKTSGLKFLVLRTRVRFLLNNRCKICNSHYVKTTIWKLKYSIWNVHRSEHCRSSGTWQHLMAFTCTTFNRKQFALVGSIWNCWKSSSGKRLIFQ